MLWGSICYPRQVAECPSSFVEKRSRQSSTPSFVCSHFLAIVRPIEHDSLERIRRRASPFSVSRMVHRRSRFQQVQTQKNTPSTENRVNSARIPIIPENFSPPPGRRPGEIQTPRRTAQQQRAALAYHDILSASQNWRLQERGEEEEVNREFLRRRPDLATPAQLARTGRRRWVPLHCQTPRGLLRPWLAGPRYQAAFIALS